MLLEYFCISQFPKSGIQSRNHYSRGWRDLYWNDNIDIQKALCKSQKSVNNPFTQLKRNFQSMSGS